MQKEKSRKRVMGRLLRVAARLMELPATGPIAYGAAVKELGLDRLQQAEIPADVAPYRHEHLDACPVCDRSSGDAS